MQEPKRAGKGGDNEFATRIAQRSRGAGEEETPHEKAAHGVGHHT